MSFVAVSVAQTYAMANVHRASATLPMENRNIQLPQPKRRQIASSSDAPARVNEDSPAAEVRVETGHS